MSKAVCWVCVCVCVCVSVTLLTILIHSYSKPLPIKLQVTAGVWLFVITKVTVEGALGTEWVHKECESKIYWSGGAILAFSVEYVFFGLTTFVMYVCIITRVVRAQRTQKQLGECMLLSSIHLQFAPRAPAYHTQLCDM